MMVMGSGASELEPSPVGKAKVMVTMPWPVSSGRVMVMVTGPGTSVQGPVSAGRVKVTMPGPGASGQGAEHGRCDRGIRPESAVDGRPG
ncbi:MAG: hypothetical protein LBT40_05405 [Deltaproteobacteria bacterium]|nr:hypothetical protein [Deltaproteobacteria bacterium]